MRILITGASGLLGRAVYEHFRTKGHDVIGTAFSRSSDSLIKLDLTDSSATKNLIRENLPECIIHCAAERRPDKVANEPAAASKLNVDATRFLASICQEFNIFLVFISTDYVFDGTKSSTLCYEHTDPTNPINLYGQLKREGELVIEQILKDYVILRVPVLYGPTLYLNESAVNGLLQVVIQSQTKVMNVDHVQKRYPTHVSDVAKVLEQLILLQPRPNGIFQYSSIEPWTKYDMCEFFAKELHLPETNISPNFTTDPTRPFHVRMSCQRLSNLGINVEPRSFKDWWKNYLSSLNLQQTLYLNCLVDVLDS